MKSAKIKARHLFTKGKVVIILASIVLLIAGSLVVLAQLDKRAEEKRLNEGLTTANNFVQLLEDGDRDSVTNMILAKYDLTMESNLNDVENGIRNDIVRLASVAGYLSGVLEKNNAALSSSNMTGDEGNATLKLTYQIPLNNNSSVGHFDLTLKFSQEKWEVEDIILKDN